MLETDVVTNRKMSAAQAARQRFKIYGPPDAPPLPLSYAEREELKTGGLPNLVAWYARSLEAVGYDGDHPDFNAYACGVMASQYAPDFIKLDRQLLERFPPRPLPGLGAGLYWDQPTGGR